MGQAAHLSALKSVPIIWMVRINALSSPISYATSYIVYSSMRTLDIWYVAEYNMDGADQRLVLLHLVRDVLPAVA